MSSILKEDDVLSKIINPQLNQNYDNFFKNTGLSIQFFRLFNTRARSVCEYQDGSEIFIIKLGENWIETDFAHELTHGQLMFLEKYPIIRCPGDTCQLIRDYIEDIIVHERLYRLYGILSIDKDYLSNRRKWTRDLFKGGDIKDEYWDGKGEICNKLHKAFLYIQAWHLNILKRNKILLRFLDSYRRRYKNSIEFILGYSIQEIIRKHDLLSNKDQYENALKEISRIEFLKIDDLKIKYYKPSEVGYKLLE